MKFIIETEDEYEARCLINAVDMKSAIVTALELIRKKIKYDDLDKKTFRHIETLRNDLNNIFEKYIEDM